MKWKSTFIYVPLWVNVVDHWAGKLETIFSYICCSLGSFRFRLVDKYCTCERCKKRKEQNDV